MSIELEHIKNKYYIHDFVEGWQTAEITKSQYYYFKKNGITINKKMKLDWERWD